MVEMTETAAILNQASSRSLVILDEIGRGTATFDGLSIAWAVLEHLHDAIGCRGLVATHYHELTRLGESLPRVGNVRMAVTEWKDTIVFLHTVEAGAAHRSYGVQAARLAGVPKGVLNRAKQVLAQLEGGNGPSGALTCRRICLSSLYRCRLWRKKRHRIRLWKSCGISMPTVSVRAKRSLCCMNSRICCHR